MNREILFRGKAINRDNGYFRSNYKNGDWVYGLVTRLYDERFERLPAEMTDVNSIGSIEVDYKTVGQYTGLTDKNGKKIFEGDIIKIPDNYDEFGINAGEVYEVYFAFGGFRLKPKYSKVKGFWLEDDATVEIIGTIHDNP